MHLFSHLITQLYLHKWFVASSLILIVIGFTATVDYSLGDNRLNLLTSQAIIKHGTVKLDSIFSEYGVDSILGNDRSAYFEKNNHDYNYFPLGTSIAAVPFVAVANAFGLDMAVKAEMKWVQRWFCVAILLAFYWIVYRIALLFLSGPAPAFLSIGLILGSQASSTMMVGHWSHNVTAVCLGLLILHQLAIHQKGLGLLPSSLFGLIAFYAYFARPASAIWILVLFLWVAILDFKYAAKAILVFSLAMGCFVAWSMMEYGDWLPKYYLPSRLGGSQGAGWLMAFCGNFVSPARGIIPFIPLSLFAFCAPFLGSGSSLARYFLLIGIVLHVAMISMFAHWWGGWSYGPRLQTESLPAILALIIMAFGAIQSSCSRALKVLWQTTFILLGLFGIFVHTVQGAYQPDTRKWNGIIDLRPENYLWNWEFPQFLAGYYPDGILEWKATYAGQLQRLLADVPQGSAYFYPSLDPNTPYLRRLTRGFNSRKDFGDIHLFNDWYLHPGDRKIYSNHDGLNLLKTVGTSFSFEPAKEVSNLQKTVKEHISKHVFIVSNCFEPHSLDSSSRSFLREIESDIVDSSGTFGLLMLIEEGRIRWELHQRSGQVSKKWYHWDFEFLLNVSAGKCDDTPKAKFQRKPLQSRGFQSYIFVLDEDSREMKTIPMIFKGADMQADATYILHPLD